MMTRVLNDSDRELAERLPAERAFTTREARDLGLTARQLARLVEVALLRRPFLGVYVPAPLDDTTEVRLHVLRLVVPEGCVVVDRTASWLYAGDRALAPNAHLVVPPLAVYCKPGFRLRSKLTESGVDDA